MVAKDPARRGQGMPHKAPSSAPPGHVVHAGRIKSTWRESRASPGIADRSRRDGRDRSLERMGVYVCVYTHTPAQLIV